MFAHNFRPDIVSFLTVAQIESTFWVTNEMKERWGTEIAQSEYCLAAANAFIATLLDSIAEDQNKDREDGAFADIFEQISADLISYTALQLKKHIEDGLLGDDVKITANFAQGN